MKDKVKSMETMSANNSEALMLIGNLAVRFRMITDEQLQSALAQPDKDNKRVGQRLLMMGFLTETQLDFLVNAQEMKALRISDVKFGAIAVENDFVTEEQVEAALQRQKQLFLKDKQKMLIGDILVTNHLMTEAQKQSVIDAQLRIKKLQNVQSSVITEIEQQGPLEVGEGVELIVSQDGLVATLRVAASLASDELRERVASLLEGYEITFGKIADEVLDTWIDQTDQRDERIEVAHGVPAVMGHGGEILYHFDIDPLKVGKIKEGGEIDFKDRGELPQVDEGALLAELSDPEPGVAGSTVQGKEIAPPVSKLKRILCGKGVSLSDDGKRAEALVNGAPSLARSGKLSVFPLYRIDGDVGYKVGHVDFDGDVQVSGAVDEGFRVKCGNLTAQEVESADIEVLGDVVIKGGILGGRIKAGGNLIASYIHNAELEVAGDVMVQKEIMNCEIKSGGGFYSETAIVLDSRISAKEGISAGDVGSDASPPSSLQIASDALLELRITELNDDIQQRQVKEQELRRQIEDGATENQQINIDIAENAQVQDRAQVEQRELLKQRDELLAQGVQQEVDEITQKISDDALRAKDAEQQLNKLFDRQDKIIAEAPQLEQEIISLEEEDDLTTQELEALEQQMLEEQEDLCVKIRGTLYPMTTITTAHTSAKTKQTMKGLMIRERAKRSAEGGEVWKIVTESLKD